MIETIAVQLSPGTYQRIRQESANSMSTPTEMIETLVLEALKWRDRVAEQREADAANGIQRNVLVIDREEGNGHIN